MTAEQRVREVLAEHGIEVGHGGTMIYRANVTTGTAILAAMLAFAAETREEDAAICDSLADLAAMIQVAVELAGGEAVTKKAQRETAETLAAAIRAKGGDQ